MTVAPDEVHEPDMQVEAFVARERAALLRFAWTMCGDVDAAEDAVQDVLGAMAKKWDQIARPNMYARRAIANTIKSRWRRARRERLAIARLQSREALLLSESSLEVWDAVRRLSRNQQVALILTVLEDRSVSYIAEVLGTSEATVRTHLRRARQRMVDHLGIEELE